MLHDGAVLFVTCLNYLENKTITLSYHSSNIFYHANILHYFPSTNIHDNIDISIINFSAFFDLLCNKKTLRHYHLTVVSSQPTSQPGKEKSDATKICLKVAFWGDAYEKRQYDGLTKWMKLENILVLMISIKNLRGLCWFWNFMTHEAWGQIADSGACQNWEFTNNLPVIWV